MYNRSVTVLLFCFKVNFMHLIDKEHTLGSKLQRCQLIYSMTNKLFIVLPRAAVRTSVVHFNNYWYSILCSHCTRMSFPFPRIDTPERCILDALGLAISTDRLMVGRKFLLVETRRGAKMKQIM